MERSEKIARLRLIRSENVGPVAFRTLTSHFSSAEEALARLPELASKGGRKRPLAVCSQKEAENELEATEKLGGRMIFSGEGEYPRLLARIPDAPPVLSVLGGVSFLNAPCVALVGTRNASINGKNIARRMAADFVKAGYTVVSGMALGIDAAAHEGALYSADERASTIAVLGAGIDVAYPRQNARLYEQIKEKGLLVSDYPLGTAPQPSNFPRRNRIISGLCKGLTVIEAALRSGSLITANKALEQGREVFAVPATPCDPRAQGVNHLIKNGAPLVETARDVLELLNAAPELSLEEPAAFFAAERMKAPQPPSEPGDATKILDKLEATPIEIDTLTRETGLPAATVSVLLVELELAGKVERLPGNRIIRISDFNA